MSGRVTLPGRVAGEARMLVPAAELPKVCLAVGGRLATMVAEDDRAKSGAFRLAYTFALPDAGWMTVEAMVPGDDPRFPSVTPLVPAAHWYEREARDMFGVVPVGYPDPRPLVHHDDWPDGFHPLRKDFDPNLEIPRVEKEPMAFHHLEGEGWLEIPVGPIHAGVIEPRHFRFATVGEPVFHLEPQLFYTRRGIEKLVEVKPVGQVAQVAERICGASLCRTRSVLRTRSRRPSGRKGRCPTERGRCGPFGWSWSGSTTISAISVTSAAG